MAARASGSARSPSPPSPRSASASARARRVATASRGQGLQHVDLRSREQGGVHLERGVLGGGADEDDVAGLDAGKEGVLLGLVESVDLVDEQDRPPAPVRPRRRRPRQHPADLLDAGEDGAERDEPRGRHVGDEPGQGGLAAAGRAPQDDRPQRVALDRLAQRAAPADEIVLADQLVEAPRAHALREGRVRRRGLAAWAFVDVAGRLVEEGSRSHCRSWLTARGCRRGGGRHATAPSPAGSSKKDREVTPILTHCPRLPTASSRGRRAAGPLRRR